MQQGMQPGMQPGMPPPGPQFPGMAPVGPELRADGQPLNDLSGRRAPAPAMSNEMLPSVVSWSALKNFKPCLRFLFLL
jgi:hypothetical protein